MKIPVDRLSGSPTAFAFVGDDRWWRAAVLPQPGLPREIAEPFQLRLAVHRMGDGLYLEGGVEGALELECSRCLARYRHRLRESIRLVLEPAGERIPADPEGAEALGRDGVCLGDELETGWFRGSEIDLGPFFREVVTLALPVKPLCQEDCAGLCPRCGADRNSSHCECAETKAESPFAVLASLRGVTGRGDS